MESQPFQCSPQSIDHCQHLNYMILTQAQSHYPTVPDENFEYCSSVTHELEQMMHQNEFRNMDTSLFDANDTMFGLATHQAPSGSASFPGTIETSNFNCDPVVPVSLAQAFPDLGGLFEVQKNLQLDTMNALIAHETSMNSFDISHFEPENISDAKNSNSTLRNYSSKPGPLRASKTITNIDGSTGEEILIFLYSRKKLVSEITISCPTIDIHNAVIQDDCDKFSEQFKRDNCIYPRATVPLEKYKGKRAKYERECNYIGWHLAYANPSIRNQRGLIQRAVDCWRNTRQDLALRSRRARKHIKDGL